MHELKPLQLERNLAVLPLDRLQSRCAAVGAEKISIESPSNGDHLVSALDSMLPDSSIVESIPRHGNTSWSPEALIRVALLWSFSEKQNVTDAFDEAFGDCQRLGYDQMPTTYQGFMGALVTHAQPLKDRMCKDLQQKMSTASPDHWRVCGWVPIAFASVGEQAREPVRYAHLWFPMHGSTHRRQ